MLYRQYGKTGKNISLLGFGSIRFNAEDLKDEEGLWRCAMLVRKASSLGVNFFDVAPVYANGQAERIYGLAFRNMPTPFFISDKSIFTTDKTADDVRRRIEQQLKIMGIDRITFYHMWSIMNYEHYLNIMMKNGPYEGVLHAKEEGLIDHICFSTHANVAENLEIIQSGNFEGMIISFNAMNYKTVSPVILAAEKMGMGIAVMNPLCGGIITKQPEYFEFLRQPEDETIAVAALRFVAAFPGITTAISGISGEKEIIENTTALSSDIGETRIDQVLTRSTEAFGSLCTGCGYCSGCPVGIPIASYMQAYNMRNFPMLEYMGRDLVYSDESRIRANKIFRTLRQNFGIIPLSAENSCIKCGLCEEKCTQHLPIINSLQEMSGLAAKHNYSEEHLCKRIDYAFEKIQKGKLGLYPSGVYADAFYAFFKKNFPNKQILIFDKNPSLWNANFWDLTIMSPEKIPENVDTLLIVHYLYQDAIYNELRGLEEKGVKVIKLHKAGDIPYFC